MLSDEPFDRPVILLTALYLLAHGGMLLLGDAIYYDDWGIYDRSIDVLKEYFGQIAEPWWVYVYAGLLRSRPELFRVMTFLAVLANGYLLFLIIDMVRQLTKNEKVLVVAFYLVLPLMFARISLLVDRYLVYNLFFVLGWYLWVRYLVSGSIVARVLAPIAFMFSFNAQSHLVFYAVPTIHAAWLCRERLGVGLRGFAARHADLLALPFIFRLTREVLLPDNGMYAGRNALSIAYLRLKDYLYLARELLSESVNLAYLAVAVLAVVSGWLWFVRKRVSPSTSDPESGWLCGIALIGMGLVMLLLAIAPYALVGRPPYFSDWASRHQLLMPLGAAVALVGVARLLPLAGRRIWIASVLSISLALDWQNYTAAATDWLRQETFIQKVREMPSVVNGTTFPVVDRTYGEYAWRSRQLRDYEFSGMMKRAFGAETRYAAELRGITMEKWIARRNERLSVVGKAGLLGQISLTDYVAADPTCFLYLMPGRLRVGLSGLARTTYWRAVGASDALRAYRSEIIEMDCRAGERGYE